MLRTFQMPLVLYIYKRTVYNMVYYRVQIYTKVKSGKFGQRPCLIIGITNKLTKQTVKILMIRLIRSRLIWNSTVCKCMSEFTRCPKLPDFTLTALHIFLSINIDWIYLIRFFTPQSILFQLWRDGSSCIEPVLSRK